MPAAGGRSVSGASVHLGRRSSSSARPVATEKMPAAGPRDGSVAMFLVRFASATIWSPSGLTVATDTDGVVEAPELAAGQGPPTRTVPF